MNKGKEKRKNPILLWIEHAQDSEYSTPEKYKSVKKVKQEE